MHRRQAYGDRGGDWSDAATSRGTTGATRSRRRKYRVPPETWPPDSLVSDSGLLDRERLSSCRFRTLRGWEFITAAYSGVHQDPGKEWGQDGWDTEESQAFWGAGGALDVGASYHCGCYNGPEHPLTLWGLWSPGISSGWTRPAR